MLAEQFWVLALFHNHLCHAHLQCMDRPEAQPCFPKADQSQSRD